MSIGHRNQLNEHSINPAAEAWKCYASFPIEGGRFIKHAPGLHAPGWNGENLPGLDDLPQQPAP